MSSFDRLFRNSRSAILTFYKEGWGTPETYRRLIQYKPQFSQQSEISKLLMNPCPITIVKEKKKKSSYIIEGTFVSPFSDILPGIMDDNNKISRFQMICPTQWPTKYRPICIHLAGTGDHNYWNRRWLLADSLLKDGIGSIFVINPFYGERQPKDQKMSSLNYLSDLFVMGGSLITECQVLFKWCEAQDLGPLAVHGISMGGFMASLAGSAWPKPVSIIPCLSWSTASSVFTDGVISSSVAWKKLADQYYSDTAYSEEIRNLIRPAVPPEFVVDSNYLSPSTLRSPSKPVPTPTSTNSSSNTLLSLSEIGRLPEALLTQLKQLYPGQSNPESDLDKRKLEKELGQVDAAEKHATKVIKKIDPREAEARQFMRELLDYFTHLGQYSRPVDNRLVNVLSAQEDAYVPRRGLVSMDKLWPGCHITELEGMGHVGAYVRNALPWGRSDFRTAICDSINLQIKLYYGEEGPLGYQAREVNQKSIKATKTH